MSQMFTDTAFEKKKNKISTSYYLTSLVYHISIPTIFSVQMWMSVCSGSHANMTAETLLAVSSVCVPQVTSSYPMAGAVKVRASLKCFLTT